MKNLTLVIPAKQEKESLPLVLKEIENFSCKKKIIVLKDDYETIEEAKKFETVEIMFQKKSGVGSAIIEGIESVQTKYFCIFMADGSTDPKFLQELYNKSVNDNLDFVFSSRYQKPGGGSDDDTLITLLGNFFFTTLGNVLFSLGISDILYNYVLGKTKSFSDLQLKSIDHRICVELPIKAKFKNLNFCSIPSFERKRFGGKKKVNAARDGLLILIEVITLFFKR
jgi:glycosyltransferase involved in cell wall biosynthesis